MGKKRPGPKDCAPLVAYSVNNYEWERGDVVFARSNTQARRRGAPKIDSEPESVEVKRAPEFDSYAPGPVPDQALYEAGWWFECHHCGARISEDEERDELDDEGFQRDPAEFGLFLGPQKGRYCCAECRGREHAKLRERDARKAAMVEWVATKYPEADTIIPGCYGEPPIYFRLPGLQRSVQVRDLKDGTAWVSHDDADAFRAMYGRKDVQA